MSTSARAADLNDEILLPVIEAVLSSTITSSSARVSRMISASAATSTSLYPAIDMKAVATRVVALRRIPLFPRRFVTFSVATVPKFSPAKLA